MLCISNGTFTWASSEAAQHAKELYAPGSKEEKKDEDEDDSDEAKTSSGLLSLNDLSLSVHQVIRVLPRTVEGRRCSFTMERFSNCF